MYRVLLIICYVCIIYGTTNVHAAESEYNVHNSKIYFRFGESVIKSWFRENDMLPQLFLSGRSAKLAKAQSNRSSHAVNR